MIYTQQQIHNINQMNLAAIEADALNAAAIVAITRNSFKLRSYLLEDLSVLRNARAKKVKKFLLILNAFNCLGNLIMIEYHGDLAKEIFQIVRYI